MLVLLVRLLGIKININRTSLVVVRVIGGPAARPSIVVVTGKAVWTVLSLWRPALTLRV